MDPTILMATLHEFTEFYGISFENRYSPPTDFTFFRVMGFEARWESG